MNLERVKGLGPSKVEALEAAGIKTVEDLAGIDLRRNVEVVGITREALGSYKQRARAVLRESGEPVPKAPRQNNKNVTITTKPQPPVVTEQGHAERGVAGRPPVKRGFLRRLLRN